MEDSTTKPEPTNSEATESKLMSAWKRHRAKLAWAGITMAGAIVAVAFTQPDTAVKIQELLIKFLSIVEILVGNGNG